MPFNPECPPSFSWFSMLFGVTSIHLRAVNVAFLWHNADADVSATGICISNMIGNDRVRRIQTPLPCLVPTTSALANPMLLAIP